MELERDVSSVADGDDATVEIPGCLGVERQRAGPTQAAKQPTTVGVEHAEYLKRNAAGDPDTRSGAEAVPGRAEAEHRPWQIHGGAGAGQ